jgi:solute carrier family 13 (sodium-dependent dicarboxylate transporter), member 2/3/5
MSWAEKKSLLLTLALLGFWATENILHPFDTASTAVAIVALMFSPGVGVMSWRQAQSKIPRGTLVLFGTGLSLGTALLQTQAATWLASVIGANLSLLGASAFMILACSRCS